MHFSSIIAANMVAASSISGALAVDKVTRAQPSQVPSSIPEQGRITSSGCWSDKGNMTLSDLEGRAVSSGACRESCRENDFVVIALQGNQCYCGMVNPPISATSKDENCNYPCPAFGNEACGGIEDDGYFSVFNLGVEVDVPNYEGGKAGPEETGSPSSTTSFGNPATSPTLIGTGTTTETPITTIPDDAAVGGFNLDAVIGSMSAAFAAIIVGATL